MREFKKVNGYHLIIVPKAVIPNWRKEFVKWLPECRLVNLIATKSEREEILKNHL
jgi:SWI/SNF-related matrix-associated actin-dependent regulator of chromatin subfamily A member 5